MRSRSMLIAGAAGLALVLTACTTPGSAPASAGGDAATGNALTGQTLIVSTPSQPDNLDPALANSQAANIVFTSFCEKLYDTNSKLSVIPGLAASLPKVASDGLSEQITLRKGVKFNDGTPLNAQAVKINLDRDKTLKGSSRVSDLAAVKSVDVVSPMTVRVNLNYPSSALTAAFASRAGLIASPQQIQKLGANFAQDPVCVGPFKFKKLVPGTELDLVKAPDYYDASKVKLAGIRYKFIVDSTIATSNLLAGDLEAAIYLSPSDAAKLDGSPGYKALKAATAGFQQISFNIRPDAGTAMSSSPTLRKAFEMSINRDAVNKAAWNSQQIVDCSPIAAQSPLYTKIPCTPFDPKGAKKLIKQSGVATPIPVALSVPNGPPNIREAQVVQSMADAVGFKVSLIPEDVNSQLVQVRAGHFDTYIEGWSGRPDPDGNLTDLVTTGGANNFSGMSNPEVDSLIKQAKSTYDNAKRKALYAQVVKAIAKQRAVIYFYHSANFTGISDKLHGVVYYPDASPRFKFAYLTK